MMEVDVDVELFVSVVVYKEGCSELSVDQLWTLEV